MKKPIPFGKYYLLDRISVGGMAEVFKAKAFGVEGFERLIAVKRILPSIAEDEEFITMFIDEAKIAVQLTHANIAQIFDLGKVGDSFFIAMEYVAGRDVRAIFDRMRKNAQTVPISMAAYITMKICEGLDYAHNKKDAAGRDLNLVHRDVSPQNILTSYDGEVKIIDFGIAKAAGKAGKTQAGILKGKFGYMSPEQVRGLPLDRRSDIFAVGICLWEMVTGERLFIGESDFSTLEKVRNVEIAPPSSFNKRLPEKLEEIILKTLSKEVEDRYQSAMDLHDDLQSWMYTSGNFFARKDLGAFMGEVFRAEVEKEIENDEGVTGSDFARSTVPPPPRPSKASTNSGLRKPVRPNAPISARATLAPPPPPRPGGAIRPSAPPRPSNPPSAKRTMLGMAGVKMPSPPNSELIASRPPMRPGGTLPRDLSAGKVAAPVVSSVVPGANADIEMDWDDDDEPPTNIYDKNTAAEMARVAVASTANLPKQSVPPSLPTRKPVVNDLEEKENSTVHEAKSQQPLFVGIGAGIIVAAVVVALLFLFVFGEKTGSIELKIEPNSALQIVLDGTTILASDSSPVTVPELPPGQHSLVINHAGYVEKNITFNIEAGTLLARQITLNEIKSGFFIETNPPGASIEIDGQLVDDKTPVTVSNLTSGTHKVKITKGDKYNPHVFEIAIAEGKIEKLPTKILELKAVEITFNTKPQGAKITLVSNGVRVKVGVSPCKYTIDTSKSYEIEYSLDKHKKKKKVLEETDYQNGKENVKLATVSLAKKEGGVNWGAATAATQPQGKGWLSVQTRPWSKVLINGKFMRNTPLVKHSLRAGTYTIILENPGFNIKKKFRVKIRPGQTTTLVKKLM